MNVTPNSEPNSTPLVVCMFDNELVRGGAEEHMLCLLRGLDRSRFRPLLVCPDPLLAMLRSDLPEDVTVLPLTLQSHRQLGRMSLLYGFLQRERVQVLHSHGFRPSLLASPVARCARVPVTVETPHVREYWRKGWKASFFIDRVAGRAVDQYIAVSAANQNYLINEKGLPAAKIALVRNGCNVDGFKADASKADDCGADRCERTLRAPADLKRLAGFAAGDPLLLVAARLEPQKGHAVLFRAMSSLKREFPDLRLVALGEGSLRSELQAQLHQLGLENSVHMPGHCASAGDMRDWMAAADLCVLPSFAEGLPLFAIECLAAERPMVATAVDGTPEVIVDGVTGLTVPPGDPDALAQAIARLLPDRQLSSTLAANGKAWVRDQFTLERQIRETEDLYERLWCAKTHRTLPQKSVERDFHLVTPC
jgi:glycosyltransferase involved in cell wall biosynthesis